MTQHRIHRVVLIAVDDLNDGAGSMARVAGAYALRLSSMLMQGR